MTTWAETSPHNFSCPAPPSTHVIGVLHSVVHMSASVHSVLLCCVAFCCAFFVLCCVVLCCVVLCCVVLCCVVLCCVVLCCVVLCVVLCCVVLCSTGRAATTIHQSMAIVKERVFPTSSALVAHSLSKFQRPYVVLYPMHIVGHRGRAGGWSICAHWLTKKFCMHTREYWLHTAVSFSLSACPLSRTFVPSELQFYRTCSERNTSKHGNSQSQSACSQLLLHLLHTVSVSSKDRMWCCTQCISLDIEGGRVGGVFVHTGSQRNFVCTQGNIGYILPFHSRSLHAP